MKCSCFWRFLKYLRDGTFCRKQYVLACVKKCRLKIEWRGKALHSKSWTGKEKQQKKRPRDILGSHPLSPTRKKTQQPWFAEKRVRRAPRRLFLCFCLCRLFIEFYSWNRIQWTRAGFLCEPNCFPTGPILNPSSPAQVCSFPGISPLPGVHFTYLPLTQKCQSINAVSD